MQLNHSATVCAVAIGLLLSNGTFAAEQCAAGGYVPDSRDMLSPFASAQYSVVLPTTGSAVRPVQQSPRLATLSGKTIALVGGSFMAHVTHEQIRQQILAKYPDARVLMFDEVGAAGPFPGPGIVREKIVNFENRLRQLGVQAVVTGNGGCGLCTPKEVGSAIVAERMGIPAVMIAGPGFESQAKTVSSWSGVPVMRVAQYPGAFATDSREILERNSREILWPQIEKALTEPISDQEIALAAKLARSDSRPPVFTGTLEDINRLFQEEGYGDGLPVMPPTAELVDRFLTFTPLKADENIGQIAQNHAVVTPRQVAVVGAMAGCRPEFMPVLIAFAKALMSRQYSKTLASTHAWAPYCWLNGPVGRQLGIQSGQGQMNAVTNKMLGRFIDLALINLADYRVQTTRMGTFGHLSSWCLSEDEAGAMRAGWAPYHVRQGFSINENTLTAASALSWGNNLTPATVKPERIIDLMA